MRWLQSFIDRQLPHALVRSNNPVFNYELRAAGTRYSPQDLKRMSLSSVSKFLRLAIVALLFVVLEGAAQNNMGQIGGPTLTLTVLMVVISVGMMLAADFSYLLTTINLIHQRVTSPNWELLRVTTLGERNILMGLYAAVLVRAWQALSLEIGLRVLIVTLIAIELLHNLASSSLYTRAPELRLAHLAGGTPIVLFIATIFIVEPLWRMRSFVGLGLRIAIQRSDHTFAVLSGITNWMATRLIQLLILPAIGGFLADLIINQPLSATESLLSLPVRFLIFGVINFLVLYAFYQSIEVDSLRHAERHYLKLDNPLWNKLKS
jgi:hypothetical protein